MTTTISNLPTDLVKEVLSMVPLKSLREVRLTCKKWNDLSKTPSFRRMHIGNASSSAAKEGESQMVTLMGCNLYLTSIVVDGDPSFELKGKLSCPDEQVKISRVYHCEGLLLCILKDDPRFLVWNPYLREKRWIQPRYSHHLKRVDRFNYALGYEDNKDKSCRRRCVKFLRFIDYHYLKPENQFFWYEMYDFDTGLWTTLDVTPHWQILFYSNGVSLKGNTYWPAAERNLDKEVVADSIICFDFTSGRFGKLLPLPFSAGIYEFVTLSSVREEKLAVLLHHNEGNLNELDIWITTKIEAGEVSWSKFLRIETVSSKTVIRFVTAGFFIDEEKKIAVGFDEEYHERFKFNIVGDAGYFRQLNLLGEPGDRNSKPHMCAYVPSFLQIEQPAGGGMGKRQSELEKLRYDEKMSGLAAAEANHKQYIMSFLAP